MWKIKFTGFFLACIFVGMHTCLYIPLYTWLLLNVFIPQSISPQFILLALDGRWLLYVSTQNLLPQLSLGLQPPSSFYKQCPLFFLLALKLWGTGLLPCISPSGTPKWFRTDIHSNLKIRSVLLPLVGKVVAQELGRYLFKTKITIYWEGWVGLNQEWVKTLQNFLPFWNGVFHDWALLGCCKPLTIFQSSCKVV